MVKQKGQYPLSGEETFAEFLKWANRVEIMLPPGVGRIINKLEAQGRMEKPFVQALMEDINLFVCMGILRCLSQHNLTTVFNALEPKTFAKNVLQKAAVYEDLFPRVVECASPEMLAKALEYVEQKYCLKVLEAATCSKIVDILMAMDDEYTVEHAYKECSEKMIRDMHTIILPPTEVEYKLVYIMNKTYARLRAIVMGRLHFEDFIEWLNFDNPVLNHGILSMMSLDALTRIVLGGFMHLETHVPRVLEMLPLRTSIHILASMEQDEQDEEGKYSERKTVLSHMCVLYRAKIASSIIGRVSLSDSTPEMVEELFAHFGEE